jgi:hypothetical protein
MRRHECVGRRIGAPSRHYSRVSKSRSTKLASCIQLLAGKCLLPSSPLGFLRAIVRPTCMCGLRLSSQFLYPGSDRAKRTESMLLCGEAVRVRAIWSVDRLLKPDRKIICSSEFSMANLASKRRGGVEPPRAGNHKSVSVACEPNLWPWRMLTLISGPCWQVSGAERRWHCSMRS